MKYALKLYYLLVFFAAGCAMASPTLTFHSNGGLGTAAPLGCVASSSGFNCNSTDPNGTMAGANTSFISYDPIKTANAHKAVAKYIPIGNFDAFGFASNNGKSITCQSCFLSFVTGLNTMDTPKPSASQFWSFSSVGSWFQITGTGVAGLSFGGPQPIVSGMFSTPITVSSGATNSDMKFVAATIVNHVYSGVTNLFSFSARLSLDGNLLPGVQRPQIL
jgi:hypothetical protein